MIENYRNTEAIQTAQHDRQSRAAERERFAAPDPGWDARQLLMRVRLKLRLLEVVEHQDVSKTYLDGIHAGVVCVREIERELAEFSEHHFGVE